MAPLAEEAALEVFAGAHVVYRGPRRWPMWDGEPLLLARDVFPIMTTTTITTARTRASEAVQGELDGLAGPRST